jgi:hypothetical protein
MKRQKTTQTQLESLLHEVLEDFSDDDLSWEAFQEIAIRLNIKTTADRVEGFVEALNRSLCPSPNITFIK